MNFLPTFFSAGETIEFRPHEATLNFEKSIMWMLICVSILKYAENIKHCIIAKKITLKEVLEAYLPKKVSEHILGYCEHRFTQFHRTDGSYRSNWEDIETKWIIEDKSFKFNNISILDLW